MRDDASRMEIALFEQVADLVLGMIPAELGPVRHREHRYGIKLWFGAEQPNREHYEAQVIGPKGVAGARTLALEVGFHAEHRDRADNERVIARIVDGERRWRKVVGPEAVVGPFLGGADVWRRVSETWPDPDLGDDDLADEIAARLADYVIGLEPVVRSTRAGARS